MRTLKDNVKILKGHHNDCDGDNGCVMDLVSYVCEYERITDHPPCACPILTDYAIILNDSIKDDALRTTLLLPLIQKLVGSKSTPGVELRRAFYFADRAVRLFAPIVLDADNLHDHATTLRNLPEIVDAHAAANAAYAADAAADAAVYAAADAAGAAAAYAADAAHAAHAADAAANAAGAAAAYATGAAAVAAAYAAGAAAVAAAADAAGAAAAYAADAAAAYAADAAHAVYAAADAAGAAAAAGAANAAGAAAVAAAANIYKQAAEVLSIACDIK